MADKDDVAAGRDQPFGLTVHLGDERAGRVEIGEAALRRLVRHCLGHTVRGEYHRNAVRHLVQFLDEHRALVAQGIDYELVVDDLMPDIDRRAIFLDRQLDDLDRPVDARAKPRGAATSSSSGGIGRPVMEAALYAIACGGESRYLWSAPFRGRCASARPLPM